MSTNSFSNEPNSNSRKLQHKFKLLTQYLQPANLDEILALDATSYECWKTNRIIRFLSKRQHSGIGLFSTSTNILIGFVFFKHLPNNLLIVRLESWNAEAYHLLIIRMIKTAGVFNKGLFLSLDQREKEWIELLKDAYKSRIIRKRIVFRIF